MSTKQLHLSKDQPLPLEVATQATSIFGIRGSGKTNTGGVIAEELLRLGQPVVIIDPTDAWWGLRSDYSVFIFGGSHGDLPLAETDGKVIAEFIVNEQVPLVLSLRHLRKGAQRRFVTELCEELYHLKGKDEYRSPLTVFIDEAPLFAPQKVPMGVKGEYPVARCVGAVEDLIARGRNSGFGVVLISQRPATLNADVRMLCDTIITHRITGPLDRKAFMLWIEENATLDEAGVVLESLAKLKNGEGWIWAPVLGIFARVMMNKRKSFDSSRTPKPGETIRPPKKLEQIDLAKLKGKLAESIEKAKAEDPKTLKAEVAKLKAELEKVAKAPATASPGKVETKRVEVKVITDAQVKRLESLYAKADTRAASFSEKLGPLINPLMELLHNERAEIGKLLAAARQVSNPIRQNPGVAAVATAARSGPTTKPAPAVGARIVAPSNGDLDWFKPAHQRLLDALAWLAAFGLDQPDRSVAAAVAGVSPRSSSFGNDVSRLSSNGLIRYPGPGSMELTDEGRARAVAPAATPTLEALHQAWRECPAFTPAHVRLLNAVINLGPDAQLSREDLAAAVNVSPKSSSFGNDVSRLSSMGLIGYPQKGFVKASKLLFPEGVA